MVEEYTNCLVVTMEIVRLHLLCRLGGRDRWESRDRRVAAGVSAVRVADAALHGAQLGPARRLREGGLPDGGQRASGAVQIERAAPLARARGALGCRARRRPHEPRLPAAFRRTQRLPRAPGARVRARARACRRRDATRDARQPRALPLLARLSAHHSLAAAAHQKTDSRTGSSKRVP